MSLTSRIPAVENAIVAGLAVRPALAGVEVVAGYPVGGPARDQVWISGDTPEWTQRWSLTGTGAQERQEDFTVKVIVIARRATTSYVEVRDRAFVLAGEVELFLRGDLTIAGTTFESEVVPTNKEEGVFDSERFVVIELSVSCTAYLS